jgi:hypothetical protein
MVRNLRWLAGAVFAVVLAALIPFLVEKGVAPKGHAVLWILYAVLGVSLVVWLITTAVGWSERSRRPKPLEIVYSLDGRPQMRVPLRRGRPQSVLVSVGFKNPNPYNLEGVAINTLFPQGLQVERCGPHGEPLDNPKGHWLTTPERLPGEPPPGAHKDYWADENVTVAGNGSKLIFFKFLLTTPGSHYLLTRVFGNVPEQQQVATLDVVETEDMDLGASLNELIYDGEGVVRSSDSVFFENSADYQRWKTELIFATAALEDEDRRWWEAATSEDVPGSGDQWRGNMAKRDVPVLYDLRRRLDRPANGAPTPPAKATAASDRRGWFRW